MSCLRIKKINKKYIDYKVLFSEARNHSRKKKVIDKYLENIKLSDYKDDDFDKIYEKISNDCNGIYGLGQLSIYDITAAICRYYDIKIKKVFIIGNGPRNAIKKLGMKPNKYKINGKITLNYVNIRDVIVAFQKNKYTLPSWIKDTKDGDKVESFLCIWQGNKVNKC